MSKYFTLHLNEQEVTLKLEECRLRFVPAFTNKETNLEVEGVHLLDVLGGETHCISEESFIEIKNELSPSFAVKPIKYEGFQRYGFKNEEEMNAWIAKKEQEKKEKVQNAVDAFKKQKAEEKRKKKAKKLAKAKKK